jgi:hypothetical protein
MAPGKQQPLKYYQESNTQLMANVISKAMTYNKTYLYLDKIWVIVLKLMR